MKFHVTPDSYLSFLKTFVIARDDVYARQTSDGRYVKVSKELTDAALLRHLQHKITIGCYNSFPDSTTKYATIDLDNHEGKEITPPGIVEKQVKMCLLTLHEQEIPYTLVRSSPGCYHVNVYFHPPAKTDEAYDYIRFIARSAGIPDAECFPKQREIPDGDYGNLIRLDFSKHQRKGTISQFIDDEFHPIDEFMVETVDISGFSSYDHGMNHMMKAPAGDVSEDETEDETHRMKAPAVCTPGGIPPCLTHLLQNNIPLTGGNGHYVRISIVCAFRDAGLPFAALCKLFTLQADYDQVETTKQVASVVKKPGGYSYSCKSLREKCSNFVMGLCKDCPRGKRFK